ncbi:uncharacterized protein K02A2.6-like [Rhagoletis pomonella]|uniref:uncharacterized protein K02A2.6-like n=1 Tax=Rhagoletis pomonella TaxID=28610 RepID=UPI00177E8A5D|nr:uncharacterized protein K02A2.6-like [Rhagoletis pomonella]
MSRLATQKRDCFIEEVDVITAQLIDNLPVTAENLGAATAKEPEVKILVECLKYGRDCEAKQRFGIPQIEFTLRKGCLLRGFRVYVPTALRQRVLSELHSGHFGMVKMKTLGRSYCWWPNLDRDIEKLVSNCVSCQSIRSDPVAVPVHCWARPGKVFERVHVDYAGPMSGKYLFVLVDAYSKWPIVKIVNNMTTDTTIAEFRDIFATFGIPNILVSDHGTQFNSKEFQAFLRSNGIVRKQGAPYHPATNGQAERFIQTVKQKLTAAMIKSGSMHKELQNILLSYRRAIHPTTEKSPAMVMFGRQIQTRLDFLLPQTTLGNTDKKITKKVFAEGERVSVRDYLSSERWQLGKIISRRGDIHYEVQLDDGRIWRRHVDQIRNVKAGVHGEMYEQREETTQSQTQPTQKNNAINAALPQVAHAPTEQNSGTEVHLRRSERVRKEPDRLQYN